MLKRAELVLKYLMKCVDTMKQMQDFEEFPSVDETLRNTVAVAPSFLAFPDSVRDLPMDVTDGQLQATQLCQTRLRIGGRTPKHKIQRQLGTEVKAEDMTPFINTTQLWRTRCVTSETIEDNPLHLDSTTEVPPPVEESFDLTSTTFIDFKVLKCDSSILSLLGQTCWRNCQPWKGPCIPSSPPT